MLVGRRYLSHVKSYIIRYIRRTKNKKMKRDFFRIRRKQLNDVWSKEIVFSSAFSSFFLLK